MNSNQINDLKQGVKNEVKAQAFGLFTVVGLFSLVVIYLTLFICIFSKNSTLNEGTKAVLSIALISFGGLVMFSEKFRNLVLRAWLGLISIFIMLLCLGLMGTLLYGMYKFLSQI